MKKTDDLRQELMESLHSRSVAHISSGEAVVSGGISDFVPGEDGSMHAVFERADALMYREKKELKAKEKKQAEKKAQEERLEKAKENRQAKEADKSDSSKDADEVETTDNKEYVEIRANSLDELVGKVQQYAYDNSARGIMTDVERSIGQNFDFKF